jgi:CheY-like chemotaxis protein
LLADDSITIQKVVQITFAHEDYELTVTDNGDAALAKARELRPHLVMADVYMPGKNGYELCAAIKQDPALQQVPVLLLAGSFEPFDEGKARAAGADAWIEKPFESQSLIDKVAALIKASSPAAATSPAAAVPAPPVGAPPPAPAPAVSDPFADISFDEPAAVAVAPANDWSDLNLTPAPAAAPPKEAFAFDAPPSAPPVFEFDRAVFAAPAETPVATADPPPIDFGAFGEPEEVMALGDDDILDAEDLEPVNEMSTLTPWSRADFSVDDTFGEISLEESSPPVFAPPPPVAPAPELRPASMAAPVVPPPAAPQPAVTPTPPAEGAPAAAAAVMEQRVATLSETEIEQIVERAVGKVIERLAGTILEKVAWEVVPDLAEVMIKEEIRKIKDAAA